MSTDLNEILSAVTDPQSGKPLPESGRLLGLDLRAGIATVILAPGGPQDDPKALQRAVEEALSARSGVERTRVIFEAPRGRQTPPRDTPPKQRPKAPAKPPARLIIAVGSGKGGVGKSTVAANLAAACAKTGLKTGLMDADVYGPSAPRLFGLTDAPGLKKTEAGIEPLEAHGVKLVSMGFLVGERDPVVWRGPMVTGAIRQFMDDVDWGDLDVLIVDMPPGTGDVQLALAQGTPLTGAVIVSTPQSLALDDAKKAIALFDRTRIPVLGIVENMSFFICPHCGEGSEIFGRGGARAEAQHLGVPFLGEIPLHPELREASDAGELIVLKGGPVAQAFIRAAHAMIEAAEIAQKPAPEIIFED